MLFDCIFFSHYCAIPPCAYQVELSTMVSFEITDTYNSASSIAAVKPAAPPPIIKTSVSIILNYSRRKFYQKRYTYRKKRISRKYLEIISSIRPIDSISLFSCFSDALNDQKKRILQANNRKE